MEPTNAGGEAQKSKPCDDALLVTSVARSDLDRIAYTY